MDFPLHLIPLILLVAAAINLLVGRHLKPDGSQLLAVGAVGASCLLAILAFVRMAGTLPPHPLHELWYTWITAGTFRAEAAFFMDPLSGVMTLIVTFVGLLIHIYSIGYMSEERDYARYFGYLNLFTGAMLLLVLGDNLMVSFVGWEGVGACSYLLIGFWYDKEANAYAGRKAFIVNRIGDFGFLLGLFLLLTVVGNLPNYSELTNGAFMARLHSGLSHSLWLGKNAAFWIGLCLFVGATGKSAQLPLYVWLPDAMAGPTPVSALIHAATMVTAGVYTVVRLHFLYELAPQLEAAIMIVGCATAFWAACMAFAQTDIKKVLAYSTISQLGFMFVGAAGERPTAGIFHLMTHAFFKAGLFLGAGSVMHAMMGRTEIMGMGGLRKKLPYTHGTFLIYCLAIAGCPPLAGFWSKDAVLASAIGLDERFPHWHHTGSIIAIVMIAIAAMTSFYMFRLYFLVFSGESRADAHTRAHIHESPGIMTAPLVILALLSVVGGLVGTPWSDRFAIFLGGAPEVDVPWREMVLGTGAFAVGLFGAYAFYYQGVRAPARAFVRLFPGVHRVVAHKFYVDEIYDVVFVRPVKLLAQGLYALFDRLVIDGALVSGVARSVDGFGYVVRRGQNGDVQRYVAVLIIGAATVVWMATRPPADFVAQAHGAGLEVMASGVGRGSPRRLKYCWRLDGAPACVSEKARDTLSLPPGKHRLTLLVSDSDWGSTASRSVEVDNVAEGHGS